MRRWLVERPLDMGDHPPHSLLFAMEGRHYACRVIWDDDAMRHGWRYIEFCVEATSAVLDEVLDG